MLAQQPVPKQFDRKLKTSTPSAGLAERLGAVRVPAPANQKGRQSLTVGGGTHPTTEPLKLRIVRDSASGLPVYIERTGKPRPADNARARVSAAAAASATFQFLGQVRSLLKLDRPEDNFTVSRTDADELGQLHVRLMQTHRGLPVLGRELVAHLTNGDVMLLNGRYEPLPENLPTTPRLALADASARALGDVRRTSRVRSFGDNLLGMKTSEGELCVFPAPTGAKLAYRLTVRPNMLERWEYVIDAQTGDVLEKLDYTCSLVRKKLADVGNTDPTTTPALAPQATGRDLNGVSRTFQTHQQTGTYYMIDTSRPMFKANTSKMPNEPVGAIWTVDARKTFGDNQKVYQITSATNADWTPTAISAHFNAGVAYEYYRTVHNRNALNGKGETMISIINLVDDDGSPLDNAYWNGKTMAYGNGDKGFKPLAGALDVTGHEMTHGVIQNTANLQYKDQSGAINESFADVFGVLIDRDDWTLGEDIVKTAVFPSGAMRSMSNPNQGGPTRDPNGYQPATMNQYEKTTEDNGGVHINSGIPNFAFYKFATAIGKEKAEKVYYRALSNYLVRTSQFLDLRLAVIKSATDLYGGTGAEVTAARAAFDAVGITEGSPTTPGKQPDVPVASGQDLLLLADAESKKLYSTNMAVTPAKFDLKSTLGLVQKPSVTDNGQTAYYVTTDKRIRAVNLVGTPNETIVSNETIWANVAISKDGTRLAALTADRDAKIYVYSFAKRKWAEFELYNPTYTEGVSTGEVRYADSFEWDFTGENIVYDAYNELANANGDAIDYWDVGFINVWNNQTGDFAKGDIEKLFANLDEGESVGNPTFSKNSPDILAFDYVNDTDGTYYVVATDLSKGTIQGVYRNNTLGFPTYSRLDNKLVFSTESSKTEDISSINLAADKITPSGTAAVLYTGAKWPVWYTQATRVIPTRTAQTITFDPITDRYSNQGDLTLRATASSGLTVAFSVRSGPATLNTGNVLKFTGAGAVTIRASQEGSSLFFAATPVDRTFQVLTVTGLEPAWSDAMVVYPNPAQTSLTVELPATETLENLSLRTLGGASVAQPAFRPRQRTATVEIGHLPKGMYLLQVQTPTGTAQRKVVKE